MAVEVPTVVRKYAEHRWSTGVGKMLNPVASESDFPYTWIVHGTGLDHRDGSVNGGVDV